MTTPVAPAPGAPQDVLDRLGLTGAEIQAIPANHGADGNANWHVWPRSGERCVLRRYHAGATAEHLRYENTILTFLAGQGWRVSEPLGSPVEHDGRWYCLTRYVPGRARGQETPQQQRQRGADLARLHVALRPLGERLGQRVGWRPLNPGLPVMTPVDWDAGLDEISDLHPRLAEWAKVAATSVTDELATLGTADLPITVIHGDFLAEQNVHYDGDRFVGVIDFAVAHLGSRPYELVGARCYRAPELLPGYVDEARRLGWPLSDTEEAVLVPLRRAFRLVLVAWHLLGGMGTGRFDAAAIESCLAGTGIDPSGAVSAIR